MKTIYYFGLVAAVLIINSCGEKPQSTEGEVPKGVKTGKKSTSTEGEAPRETTPGTKTGEKPSGTKPGEKLPSTEVLTKETRTLFDAAISGDLKLAESLLAKNASPNAVDQDGYSPLHHAVLNQNKKLVELLLSNKAEVNKQTPDLALAPIHLAALLDNADITQILLAKGADANIKTKNNEVPLHFAYGVRGDSSKVAAQLKLVPGIKLDIEDNQKRIPDKFKEARAKIEENFALAKTPENAALMDAFLLSLLTSHEPALLRFALSKKPEIAKLKYKDGGTLLHLWAERPSTINSIKVLVNAKADINALDQDEATPLMLALKADAYENVKYLREQGGKAPDELFKKYNLRLLKYLPEQRLEEIRSLIEKQPELLEELDKEERFKVLTSVLSGVKDEKAINSWFHKVVGQEASDANKIASIENFLDIGLGNHKNYFTDGLLALFGSLGDIGEKQATSLMHSAWLRLRIEPGVAKIVNILLEKGAKIDAPMDDKYKGNPTILDDIYDSYVGANYLELAALLLKKGAQAKKPEYLLERLITDFTNTRFGEKPADYKPLGKEIAEALIKQIKTVEQRKKIEKLRNPYQEPAMRDLGVIPGLLAE